MFSAKSRLNNIMKIQTPKQTLVRAIMMAFLASPIMAASGAECVTSSSKQRVALLELYTSEGCSSCPPTDRWLSALKSDRAVPAALLPLAFHVDYWNDIGWADPFSQAGFSNRQREHSRRRGARFVVTPQLLLDGVNYQRPLLFSDIDTKTQAINRTAPEAEIRMTEVRQTQSLAVRVDAHVPDKSLREAKLFIAVYENNLRTKVTAGENAGSVLTHDFVVRELSAPVSVYENGGASQRLTFHYAPHWKPQDLHVAAFVQHDRSGRVLQALNSTCR